VACTSKISKEIAPTTVVGATMESMGLQTMAF